MYLTCAASTEEPGGSLTSLLKGVEDGESVLALLEEEGGYEWALRTRSAETTSGQGVLSEAATENAVSLGEVDRIVFMADRSPFLAFLNRLSPQEKAKCSRETFSADCRLAGAIGLYEEQGWCESAFARDRKPAEPTAYIVRVLGSSRYFGYFNLRWESDDDYTLKSCHDLRQWCQLYIPNLYGQRDVEKWVFLERDVFQEFSLAAPEYKRAFVLREFPFESLATAGSQMFETAPRPAQSAPAAPQPAPGFWRSAWQAMFPDAKQWTRSDDRLVNRLCAILDDGADGPIDLRKAPGSLEKLKRVLAKRLATGDAERAAVTRQRAVKLYLALSRFYERWDELNAARMFIDGPNRVPITVESILECKTVNGVMPELKLARSKLRDELVALGYGDLLAQIEDS